MIARILTKTFLMLAPVLLIGNGYVHADNAVLETVTVFCAGSTTNAVSEIADMFMAQKKGKVILSFASSSTLAKQIDNGAPADVYISANKKWMDYLEKNHLLSPGTRFDLLSNRIVLITPHTSNVKLDIVPGFPLAGRLGKERLSMGNPDHVPAGIYGRQALQSLGIWKQVAPAVARSKDVRAALALVERGEAPFGIVYATDAAITDKVSIAGVFPENTHPPIVYPAAILKGRETAVAGRFLNFLKSDDARTVFETYGFKVR